MKLDNIKLYRHKLLTDYLLFTKEIEEDLILNANYLVDYEYLEYLEIFIDNLIKNSIYPHEIKENLSKLITYIGSILENEECKELYNNIYNKYISNDFNNSYDFYYFEFAKKFQDMDLYLKSNYQMISKKELDTSIKYDLYILFSYGLEKDKYLESLRYFVNNPYYLMAINKFLYEIPEIFYNDIVKKRTLGVLNYNITLLEENSDKENQKDIDNIRKTMDRINNLNAYNLDNTFNIIEFKEYYNILLIRRILFSNERFSTSEYKDYIKSKLFIHSVEDFVKDNVGIDKHGKERLISLIKYVREDYDNNEMKLKLNNLNFEISNIKPVDRSGLCIDELLAKNSYTKVINTIVTQHIGNIEDMMKKSIEFDFETMKAFISDEKTFEQLLKSKTFNTIKFIYSLRIFILENPGMFSSDLVYKRTLEIINNNIEQCKEEIKLNEFKKDNKKFIKEQNKVLKKIKKIRG